jgi:hypothetical protein
MRQSLTVAAAIIVGCVLGANLTAIVRQGGPLPVEQAVGFCCKPPVVWQILRRRLANDGREVREAGVREDYSVVSSSSRQQRVKMASA